MVEQVIHQIDLVRHLMGEPDTVYARRANLFHRDVPGYDVEDVSAIVFGWDDGRIATLNASNIATPGVWHKEWQVFAERLTGRFTELERRRCSRRPDGRAEPRTSPARPTRSSRNSPMWSTRSATRAPPLVPLRDGAATLRAGARRAAVGRRAPGGAAAALISTVAGSHFRFAPLLDGAVPAASARRTFGDSDRLAARRGRIVELSDRPRRRRATIDVVGARHRHGARQPRAALRRHAGVRHYLRNGYRAGTAAISSRPARRRRRPAGQGADARLRDDGAAAGQGERRGGARLRPPRPLPDALPLRRIARRADDRRRDAARPHRRDARARRCICSTATTVEETLRRWSARVAAASPVAPRLPEARSPAGAPGTISTPRSTSRCCSSISPPRALSATSNSVPLDIFLIDDGFTPEMGDWLDVKPQFPHGMAPLLADIAAAGFRPGLWIAPFMVGNRSQTLRRASRLGGQDAVTRASRSSRCTSTASSAGTSERGILRPRRHPPRCRSLYRRRVPHLGERLGCRYIKTDFMLLACEYGPDRAIWHKDGLSRIAIWLRMVTLIRERSARTCGSAAAARSGRRSGWSTRCASAAISA